MQSLSRIEEIPKIKSSISKKSKRSSEKYDYKLIYEGGKGGNGSINFSSKRESTKPKPLDDDSTKNFEVIETDNTPINKESKLDIMSDTVVQIPE